MSTAWETDKIPKSYSVVNMLEQAAKVRSRSCRQALP